MSQVVVVGAGVIGLTCAYQLCLKGNYNVTIVAKDFPSTGLLKPEYTSSKSGAHFRPFPSKSAAEFRDSRLTRSTYNFFKKLAVEHPESSIKWMTGTDFMESAEPLYMTLGRGYTEGIDDFAIVPKEKLPEGIVFGASYTTWCINAPAYLDFLESELSFKYGVKFVQKEVGSLKEVAETYPDTVIINCTGMGLRYDGSHDPASYHIRGQTLLVRAPLGCKYVDETVTFQLANGQWTFVIPRPLNGGVIVGGTKVTGATSPLPDAKETADLISNAEKRFPELLIDGKFDIRRVNVGFRPARKGGVKIESSKIEGHTIIDCYGFAGSGMEMSWGAGEKVVELYEKATSSCACCKL